MEHEFYQNKRESDNQILCDVLLEYMVRHKKELLRQKGTMWVVQWSNVNHTSFYEEVMAITKWKHYNTFQNAHNTITLFWNTNRLAVRINALSNF